MRKRTENIIVNVGNDQFDTRIARIADKVRVDAEKRKVGSKRVVYAAN